MWDYTDKVMDHFLNPKNVGEIKDADAVGEVGNMSCGDALKLFLKLDDNERIVDVSFQTFGCASAIASSSALTEIVKGMTLDEAAKVTNNDIVDVLGELPEAKMHCSVMGMEGLQAAIASYRGEDIADDENDDHEGRIVCHCFGVTDVKIHRVAKDNGLKEAEEIKNYCKAGGACGCCLNDIQEILDGLWREEAAKAEKSSCPAKVKLEDLSIVKRVLKVQEIIEEEVSPILEQDGGAIELIDLIGNVVKVKLKGRCAVCPSSQVTLKNTVEAKLREFIADDLIVENV